MAAERIVLSAGGAQLSGTRWRGSGPLVVLLHSGVCDRRSWFAVGERLAGLGTLVAYDRRGFGESKQADGPFTHVDDLVAVLDQLGGGPAWLVGSSMGGGIVLDTAVAHPDLVAGLVVITPAVSGAPPEQTIDAAGAALEAEYERVQAAGDFDAINRLDVRIWLDGARAPEGRVTGPVRELALDMNRLALANEGEHSGASGVDAWSRLGEIRVPTTVAWGVLDLPELILRCAELVDRIPGARGQALADTAHLPYLDAPDATADLIRTAVRPG